MMVTVYRYKAWDQLNGTFAIPERRATPGFIQAVGGEIFEKTAHEIDDSLVSPDGQEILDKTKGR
jgi:hypothetical protein